MWSLGTAGSRNFHDVVQRSQPLSISYSPLYSLVSPFCMVASFFPVTGSCFMPGKIDTGKSHLQPYSFWSKRKTYAFSPNSIDQTSSNSLSVSLLVPPISPTSKLQKSVLGLLLFCTRTPSIGNLIWYHECKYYLSPKVSNLYHFPHTSSLYTNCLLDTFTWLSNKAFQM